MSHVWLFSGGGVALSNLLNHFHAALCAYFEIVILVVVVPVLTHLVSGFTATVMPLIGQAASRSWRAYAHARNLGDSDDLERERRSCSRDRAHHRRHRDRRAGTGAEEKQTPRLHHADL